jgi:hypothetical protein
MSGSGPGSGTGGPGEWIPQNNDACETLTQQLALNSPNPSVLKLLKPNDLLEVRSQKINGAVIVEALSTKGKLRELSHRRSSSALQTALRKDSNTLLKWSRCREEYAKSTCG